MVFLFPLDKADLYHNYIKTNTGGGMYEHLHFQLKYQHFWACCPKQSGVWVDFSSWIDFCTFRKKNTSLKWHSSWLLQQRNPERYLSGPCFSAPGFLWGPRWGGATQGQQQPNWRGLLWYRGHIWLIHLLSSHHMTERRGAGMLQNKSHSTKNVGPSRTSCYRKLWFTRYLNAGLKKTNLKAIDFQLICMQEMLVYEITYPKKEG